jgi:hypothetical protein
VRDIKFLILIACLLLTFTSTALASQLEISGSLKGDLIVSTDDGKLTDQEKVNLILEKGFGFDAEMYIDLGFREDHNNADTDINEAYLNYYTDNMDWRIGKQLINWGSSYKLQPTDYFNPVDRTALKPLDEKLGVEAVKGIYYAPNGLEITGVVVPFFKADKLSTFIPNLRAVEDNVENMQEGFKVTKRSFKGFDLSLSGYHGFDRKPINNNMDFIYPELNRIGFDLIGDIGEMGVWTELAYAIYQDEEFDNGLETTLGADYKWSNDLYLVLQAYYQQGRLSSENDTKVFNLHFDKPIFNFHQVEGNFIYEFETETIVLEPQFNYSLANSIELQIGGTYINSQNDDALIVATFGQDRVYTRLNIEF